MQFNVNNPLSTTKDTSDNVKAVLNKNINLKDCSRISHDQYSRNNHVPFIDDKSAEPEVKTVQIQCRSIRIGSFKTFPVNDAQNMPVHLRHNTISFKVPKTTDESDFAFICLEGSDIMEIAYFLSRGLQCFFIQTNLECTKRIQVQLGMVKGNSSYYDPMGMVEHQKRITFFLCESTLIEIARLDHNIKVLFPDENILKKICSWNDANKILVKSVPVEVNDQARALIQNPEVKKYEVQFSDECLRYSEQVMELHCTFIRLGSWKISSMDKLQHTTVYVSSNSFVFHVPQENGVRITLTTLDIRQIAAHFDWPQVMFIVTTTSCTRKIAVQLGFTDGINKYYNPKSSDETVKRIAFFIEDLTDEKKNYLRKIFLFDRKMMKEINKDLVAKILKNMKEAVPHDYQKSENKILPVDFTNLTFAKNVEAGTSKKFTKNGKKKANVYRTSTRKKATRNKKYSMLSNINKNNALKNNPCILKKSSEENSNESYISEKSVEEYEKNATYFLEQVFKENAEDNMHFVDNNVERKLYPYHVIPNMCGYSNVGSKHLSNQNCISNYSCDNIDIDSVQKSQQTCHNKCEESRDLKIKGKCGFLFKNGESFDTALVDTHTSRITVPSNQMCNIQYEAPQKLESYAYSNGQKDNVKTDSSINSVYKTNSRNKRQNMTSWSREAHSRSKRLKQQSDDIDNLFTTVKESESLDYKSVLQSLCLDYSESNLLDSEQGNPFSHDIKDDISISNRNVPYELYDLSELEISRHKNDSVPVNSADRNKYITSERQSYMFYKKSLSDKSHVNRQQLNPNKGDSNLKPFKLDIKQNVRDNFIPKFKTKLKQINESFYANSILNSENECSLSAAGSTQGINKDQCEASSDSVGEGLKDKISNISSLTSDKSTENILFVKGQNPSRLKLTES